MIAVTGSASVALGPGDAKTLEPTEFLRSRKTRKFMGTQDDLAVLAAGTALGRAQLGADELGERAGLFAVVGYIPFNAEDIDPVLAASLEGERFSMQKFSSGGFQRAHPLLTFRCLPNMPAFHVSANFDLQGPYFVSYPGPAQVYAALEEAQQALAERSIDVAVVLAVAHQRNFLVEHHFQRLSPPTPAADLWDVGACVVLQRAEDVQKPRATLLELKQSYDPHAALESHVPCVETLHGVTRPAGERGPATLFSALDAAIALGDSVQLEHVLQSRDHVNARSRWQVLS